MHVGHPEGYTATDIMARYKRMNGFNVLHPMGWDAFGLPAERYAMKTGIHPEITTRENIQNFKRQLKALGFSYDWDREINTTSPDYYKHTQKIFLLLFNSWYDKELQKARPIDQLPIPQDLKGQKKIDFIDSKRLAYIDNVPVNWCADLGTVLANEEVQEWVQKGYKVERKPMRQWMLRITEYCDRLLKDLDMVDWPAGTLDLQKNWIGRSEGALVQFPINGANDSLFIEVYTTRPDTLFGATYLVLAPEHPLLLSIVAADKKNEVQSYINAAALKTDLDRQSNSGRGKKSGVNTWATAVNPLTKESIPIYTSDYVLMGYGTGAIMAVPAHDERDFEFAKTFSLPIKQVVQPKNESNLEGECFSGEGICINSNFLDGMETKRAKSHIINYLEENKLGKGQVNYRLRDWLFSRQRYWGEPIPISYDDENNFVPLQQEELPLLLPQSNEFQPAETGESPLKRIESFMHYKDKTGRALERESNTMPQWAGSCWYYLRYTDPNNKNELAAPENEKYWLENGVDLYIGGAEHAVLHLLYARFWHKLLYDYNLVSYPEPFKKLVHQGIILGEDNVKMSKSRGNVINPDDVVAKFGADSFRMFEMFMGPLEMMKPWSSTSIEGIYRFLSKVYKLMITDEDKISEKVKNEPSENEKSIVEKALHKTIDKITSDIERLSYNTAISQLMICVNEFSKVKSIGSANAKSFVIILSPFAPHLAEELWEKLGSQNTIAYEPWPRADKSKMIEKEVEIVFQVNGKVRGKGNFAVDTPSEQIQEVALADEGVRRFIADKPIRKVIVVPNKIVSIVV